MTPRPAAEQLVAATRAHVGDRASRVVDVGTGSGAVAVAIAKACPHAEVWATDTSADAVLLARANVRRHELDDRVSVGRSDLLGSIDGRFDVIAANLPYLPASAAANYPELEAEPFDAVFAAGDGLEPYRRLVRVAGTRLTETGILLLQLDGRLVTARRYELSALQGELGRPWPAEVSAAAVVESIAGKAA
jgi:HemK-like putative methylase